MRKSKQVKPVTVTGAIPRESWCDPAALRSQSRVLNTSDFHRTVTVNHFDATLLPRYLCLSCVALLGPDPHDSSVGRGFIFQEMLESFKVLLEVSAVFKDIEGTGIESYLAKLAYTTMADLYDSGHIEHLEANPSGIHVYRITPAGVAAYGEMHHWYTSLVAAVEHRLDMVVGN